MNFLNYIQSRKNARQIKELQQSKFVIKSYYEQVVDHLQTFTNSDKIEDYSLIVSEMKKYLNYHEIELLHNLATEIPNTDGFLLELEKNKYHWAPDLTHRILNDIQAAKLSLCTSDFLAFVIGLKCDVNQLIIENGYWTSIYHEIDLELNKELLETDYSVNKELKHKAHVPINHALSMFLLYDKEVAKNKFNAILSDDLNYRIEASYQEEYLLIYERFFKRLKLDFIPKINFKDKINLVDFTNSKNQYMTKKELIKLIDNRDYFNLRPFDVDSKKLLNENNYRDSKLLVDCFFSFFKFHDEDINYKDVEILISCFTEKYSRYDRHEISLAKTILNDLVRTKRINMALIYFSYYMISSKTIKDSKVKLAYLLSNFFNSDQKIGMSNSAIIDVFTKRNGEKVIFTQFLDEILLKKVNEIIC
jgi:hypothetical protein